MPKNWKEVRKQLSPEREVRVKAGVAAELSKMPLAELRRARSLTQQSLARHLHVNQAAVSKLEQRADMYLSTLRSYIEAMGGALEMRAVFPEGEVVIDTLDGAGAKEMKDVA